MGNRRTRELANTRPNLKTLTLGLVTFSGAGQKPKSNLEGGFVRGGRSPLYMENSLGRSVHKPTLVMANLPGQIAE